jgi:2-hydroxymuconate-semialdehyde hydrolase
MTTTTTTTTKSHATRNVPVGPYTIYLAENGDASGEPVIWLHGSGPGVTSLSNWEDATSDLPQYHNYCPDILGFGYSTHPDPPPIGMSDWTDLRAQTIVNLMDELGIRKAHFVGNSMGGAITLNIVKRWPERVGKIVLMGSGGAPFKPGPALAGMVGFYDAPSTERLRAMLAGFVYDKEAYADRLQRVAEARIPLALRDDVKRSHLTTFTTEGARRPSITEAEIAAIANPTLILHGREDQMIPLSAGMWLAERIPNAQLHVFAKTGHWTQIEQHDRFVFLVDAFFTGKI